MILYELIPFEYLRLTWWLILGVLLIGFALTDGFDMGTGALLPFVAKTDAERRVVINTIGPVWEGNQVWFILGGGAIFAAFPPLYAISFSSFYLVMFAILAALIVRPVGFKFRSKREDPKWRARWDAALCFGGAAPALLFGVAVGNVLLGIPFYLTPDLLSIYDGPAFMKFFGLLRPFALLCGIVSLAMLVMHGAGWLVLKTEGAIADRARRHGVTAAKVVLAGYALAGLWLAFFIDGYALVNPPDPNGASNPLASTVSRSGSWLSAYADRPWIAIAPAMGFLGTFMAMRALRSGGQYSPLGWSKMAIFGMISSVGLTMFPFLLPSSTSPDSSLTIWDASSSHQTLFVMLVATVIFLPLILAYTAWVYRVLWGKVTEDDVSDPERHSY
ncbi:MAG: cytochrome d ubiquinol oxidase subunit II [Paracoccus sp. (in: a-proteobacteria)]|uniref:cytochrome d ubiquinol oxidase subunit II n=1 Tax=unclassified Paracoccus (in: a-proteobacteria) TaxID=2688777 RepID=UPI000C5DA155|nr:MULTISPECIES: cytochrome d ubiquinol oxidase subunit II [unclassified Paracoccus (in: a-proteobacteria)]MAN56458.1 cytochrome d ubiquinol oxidase subunit II [Paracoccus sp. (in: a-proteobacteria)]MBA50312.1 cytochrome d ubiquinol oxidase subunit II [Paracoccus sp. (in: a-proteobacteria)]MCS5601987.1 cytochrome d ubiquinol oxidase subunit II [Paracoccus sp. (in: a-proteobacteria)]|tara:strand:- start:22407 stop:23570 length:1164 start_codon:yes stop_codon:yes gene_type:complete